jgi:transposase-like protein
MVNEVAGYSKGDIKINEEYKPQWFGYLTVDDKYFGVKADKKMILTATDSSGDLVHMEIFKYIEQQRIDEFIRFIKEHLKYPFKAITTDLDEMLEKSIQKELGNKLPHQKCLKHALDSVDKIVQLKQKRKSYQKAYRFDREDFELKEKEYKEAEIIFTLSKQLFYSSDKRQSKRILKGLKIYKGKYPKLFDFFNRHLYKLLIHQSHPVIKKTNNIAENINRQLMRRLKTIESFQKLSYAENYLNLYKNYLRFKPYTDCRKNNKFKNGKSPLEVCGVVLNNKDWLKNAVCFY